MVQNIKIPKIEEDLGYTFKNKQTLITAFTHSSLNSEVNNERLEFLGDAVLELTISEYLYKNFNLPEGKMTRLRSNIVCTESLSLAAHNHHFGDYLLLGKGELMTGGKKRKSNLANLFEAVMGGIFLDSDYQTAREVILRLLEPNIQMALDGTLVKDYKTELQERVQAHPGYTIKYIDIGSRGPEHMAIFTCELLINDISVARGSGKSKKEAQQEAAKKYLRKGKI